MSHADNKFRPDIQLLRAVAVSLVVLFHVWPNMLPGGYVGVDVFFVISGFLIYAQLLRTIERTGSIDLMDFWVRRIKRLQPAALFVLFFTAVGILLWVPRSLQAQWMNEIVASALQLQNWLLGLNAVDYLAAENEPSPTQHYWSLSVEEQFYIGLPLLLITLLGIAKRCRFDPLRALPVGIGLIAACSFLFSLWQTTSSPSIAYFSTLTRAWEFGLGALLVHFRFSPGYMTRNVAAALGLAGIVISAAMFGAGTAFPGYAAVLPVAGAVLCLWAGPASLLELLGKIRPIAAIGHYSYSIYLWHWPIVILSSYAIFHWPFQSFIEHAGGDKQRIVVVVLALVLAKITTDFVENPIRFNPRLLGAAPSKRVVALVLAASLAALSAVCAVPMIAGTGQMSGQEARLIQEKGIDELPECFGAKALDLSGTGCPNGSLTTIYPDIAFLKKDNANLEECWVKNDVAKQKFCSFGPDSGARKRVLAVGDSHIGMFHDVFKYIAEKNSWRIDVAGRPGCYLTTADQKRPSEADWQQCKQWRADVLAYAASAGYDGFIVTHSSGTANEVPAMGKTREQTIVEGMAEAWARLPDGPIVAIVDNPFMSATVRSCLHVEAQKDYAEQNFARCQMRREDALQFDGQREAAALLGSRVRIVDMTKEYCSDTECAAVVGNVIVYRDGHHITRTYTKSLAPYFNRGVVEAMSLNDSDVGVSPIR